MRRALAPSYFFFILPVSAGARVLLRTETEVISAAARRRHFRNPPARRIASGTEASVNSWGPTPAGMRRTSLRLSYEITEAGLPVRLATKQYRPALPSSAFSGKPP